MLLARKDESRHRMNIVGLAGNSEILTVAIFPATALNFSSVLRNEEIQSTRLIGSVPLTADTVLSTRVVTNLISEMVFFAASRAVSAVVTSGVSSWSDGVSWVIHVRVSTTNWE